MMATFIFEVGAALYLLWRYKLNQLTRLCMTLLFLLAIFQLAEFMVCEGVVIGAVEWARGGFVAITLLPPLGLQIIEHLAGKRSAARLFLAYIPAVLFIGYFIFASAPFAGEQCLGNYVIFQVPWPVMFLYGAYYYILLAWGILRGVRLSQEKRLPNRSAIRWFAIGYASFLIPTATVNLLQPETLQGIPSVMCGFAVFLAVIIVAKVLPQVDKQKRKRHTSR